MRLAPLFFGAVILSTTACTSIQVYREPVTQLSEATQKTREAIETLSNDATDAKIRAVALNHAATSRRFGENDMTPSIAPEYIKARVAGLRMIERFLTRLTEVVEAKDDVPKSVDALAEDAKKLADQLKNTKASAYVEPVGGLAKAVIALYDETKRKSILERGLRDGVPHAKQLIAILKKELAPGSATDIGDVVKVELKAVLVERIAAYDRILKSQETLSAQEKNRADLFEARLAAIEKIIDAKAAHDRLSADAAFNALQSMEEALDALASLAKQDNYSPQTFAVFLNRVSLFSERAVTLLEAANAIRKVTNEAKK